MAEEQQSAQTPEGLRFTERLAWLGFMLFFVIVLTIYIARGIGLERDVTEANRELLQTQQHLAQYLRHEIPRPTELGLTHAQIQSLQRRGLARPEPQLRDSLLEQSHLLSGLGPEGGALFFDPEGVHVLNQRWVLAYVADQPDPGDAATAAGVLRGQVLLEYEVVHGNVFWQLLEVSLD